MNQWDNESIVRQIQTGQGNRNELLEKLWLDNLGLIRKIIHELTGLDRDSYSDWQDFEDLEQQAFLGISESVNRYDSTREIKFFSFATHYIRYYVYRYYDRNGQIMRVPSYMRTRIKRYLQEKERLEKNGESCTDEIIMSNIGLSKTPETRQIFQFIERAKVISSDSYLNESDKESGTILDMIASNENTSENVLSSTYLQELHTVLHSAICELPEIERGIIKAYWYQGMNTKHIAKVRNCTRQNVSKHLQTAYKRIRTGKYAKELLTFLPEWTMHRATKLIQDSFKDLSEQERELLI